MLCSCRLKMDKKPQPGGRGLREREFGVYCVPCSLMDGVSVDVDSLDTPLQWMRIMVIVHPRIDLCFLSNGVGLCAGGIETHKPFHMIGAERQAVIESVHVLLILGQEFA